MTQDLGTEQRPLRVGVIGSGPSAFYAADAVFRVGGLHARVDMFDRLPTPFGLVRGGVAPDHQNIKAVVKVYQKVAEQPGYRFFGHVQIGRDLLVTDLEEHYHMLVWAVGCESDQRLGIPGEDLSGVHSATEFVGWYNGHPDFRERSFDLAAATRVAVVGNGNVAMDVARILLKDPEALATTDIADHALTALRASKVREVYLLGRRGPAQAAFSPKEIEEIAELPGVDVVVAPAEAELDPYSAEWLATQKGSAQRNVAFLQERARLGEGGGARKLRCRFLVLPVEVKASDGRVAAVRVQCARLEPDAGGTPRPRPIDRFETLPVELVFEAIGYRGVPVPGMSFDPRKGIIPNADGRVLGEPGGPVRPGHYVVGWAKRGPTGLVGTNSPDSKATVERMVADLQAGKALAPRHDAIEARLRQRGIDFVTWQDWQRLDAHELAEGNARGKVRHKEPSVEALMAAVRRLRPR
ncbi:MAG: NADP oxidoreductase [Planctomycetes bacterium]|nr:NADP oxidoreductase [Planctomycetota bacterium]